MKNNSNENILLFLKATWIAFGISVIGGLFIYFGSENHFFRDFGIALVPVGLIALVYEIFLRKSFIAEIKNEFSEAFYSHFISFDQMTKAGLVNVHEKLNTSEMSKFFCESRKVRILQTWSRDISALTAEIERKAENLKDGFKMQILILDPESSFTAIRCKELGYPEDSASKNINQNLLELTGLGRKANIVNKIEVRLYDSTPTACIHSYDETIFLGLYWYDKPSMLCPQFEIKGSQSDLFKLIDRHFEGVWNSAKKKYNFDTQTIELINKTQVENQ